MTYDEAYHYLLSLGNVSRLQYHADRKNCIWYLKRMQWFLNLIGNPERKIPHYIHVTGTSGKGSVCLMFDAILRAAGHTVGTLTSPHPSEITERWELNGTPMARKEFARLVEEMKPKLEQCLKTTPYDLPSFAELMTAFGLYYFARHKAGWAVMEVACGGRYDATNIIPHKDAAVITNIGLDHVDLIGPTKQDIAYEKAGIIKVGAKVFTAERNKKLLAIFKRECKKQRTSLVVLNPKPEKIMPRANPLDGVDFTYRGSIFYLPTLGAHQIKNAIVCIEVARSLGIPERAIQKGLTVVKLPIRMEAVSRRPLIILDGAHNPDKIKTTVQSVELLQSQLSGSKNKFKKIHLVVSFAANKNISGMIKQLAKLKPASVACTRFTSNIFRKAADPKNLAAQFKKFLPLTKTEIFLDPLEALAWSKRKQKTSELLLVTGSIFLSGAYRLLFTKNSQR